MKPNLLRTPLFPAMLVIPLAVHEGFASIIVFNCVVFALVCLTLWVLAGLVGHRTAGVLAAAWLALDPLHVLNATKCLSDIPLLLLLAVAIASFVHAHRTGRRDWAMYGFLFLGLATLTKPVALYVIPPIATVWLVIHRNRRSVVETVTGLGICMLLIGAWVGRNQLLYGVPALTSATAFNAVEFHALARVQEGRSLATNFFDPQLSIASFKDRDVLLTDLYERVDPRSSNSEKLAALKQDGQDFARGNPVAAAKMWFTGLTRLLFNGVWTKYVSGAPLTYAWHASAAIVNALLIALSVVGSLKLWRRGDRLTVCLIMSCVIVLTALSAPAANPRLRLNFFPLAYVLSAIGALSVSNRIARAFRGGRAA